VTRRGRLAGLGAAGLGMTGLLGAGVVAPATAAAASSFTSTIYSAAIKSCVDVPGGTTDINTNLVGKTCSGAAEQRFTFTPVAGHANTYTLINAASKECAHNYRLNVRQQSCSSPAPNPSWDKWVLLPVNASAHQYQLEPADYAGDGKYARVVGAHPAPPGYPTPILTLDLINTADPAQTFVIAAAT